MTDGASRQDRSPVGSGDVRERILATASDLFYREGVRAVGVDLVVARAGVAKTSLYRHFPSKDHLIQAFLEREDRDFWRKWDEVAAAHEGNPAAELEAHLAWIGNRVARPGYRGCPQINVAAEFPSPDHPARAVAIAHKAELRRRLTALVAGMSPNADELGGQLALIINGAFASGPFFDGDDPATTLSAIAGALIGTARAIGGER